MISLTNYDSSEVVIIYPYIYMYIYMYIYIYVYIYICIYIYISGFTDFRFPEMAIGREHLQKNPQSIGSPLVPPDDTPLPRGWVSQLQPRTVDPRPRAGLPIVRGQWPLESLPQILKKTLHIAKTLDVGPRGFSWKMGPMPLVILRNYPDATCPQFWEQELTKFEITRC